MCQTFKHSLQARRDWSFTFCEARCVNSMHQIVGGAAALPKGMAVCRTRLEFRIAVMMLSSAVVVQARLPSIIVDLVALGTSKTGYIPSTKLPSNVPSRVSTSAAIVTSTVDPALGLAETSSTIMAMYSSD